MDLGPYSRFQNTPEIIHDGVETFGSWVPPRFISDPGSLASGDVGTLLVRQNYAGRPDTIAQDIYGSHYLDWVIIAFNKATTLNWPPVGSIIRYPLPHIVFRDVD